MATQNSKGATKGSKNVTKNAEKQVKNQGATQRVVVTRDEYAVVYDHAVSLVVAYALGQTPEKPREGFAFGPIANGSHTRNYAKSLIWGFATSKAGKAIKAQKSFEELADKTNREKIAIAILSDCSLVKGDSKAIAASLSKVEPKREKTFAEAVLTGLKAATEKPATPKGGRAKKSENKSNTPKGVGESLRADYEATVQATNKLLEAMGGVEKLATAPKGSKAKGESKPKTTTPKGGKAKSEKKAAPKGAKANGTKATK